MDKPKTSRLPGFYKSTIQDRRNLVAERLPDQDITPLKTGGLDEGQLDKFVENAIGTIGVPVGIATNFLINGREVLVPMAVEEPSVIAAASNAARFARLGGGFTAEAPKPLTVAQVEILHPEQGATGILARAEDIIAAGDATQPELVRLGGGMRQVEVRENVGSPHRMVVHLTVDCKDAMGANIVNTMAEAVAPLLEQITGGKAGLRILTNLADKRLAGASCCIEAAHLSRGNFSGDDVAAGVARASDFAAADPYRAATHNKGIFNGVDAVLLATGNDWRAVEAGAHAYAASQGTYRPLATWNFDGAVLEGKIEMPMAIGVVGGASRSHPCAKKCLEIMEANTAAQLSCIAISAGLASNLAALMALATEGIQRGHMRLHNKRL